MWKFLESLFNRRRRRRRATTPAGELDTRLNERLAAIRAKLDRWLVTRRSEPGPVKKTARWALTKTNQGLYRLEAPGVSVMISTEPFLTRQKTKEGDLKITGLLRMSELALSGAVHGAGELATFFQKAEPVQGPGRELFVALATPAVNGTIRAAPEEGVETVGERLPEPGDLTRWEPFALDQMIVRNSPNTLAHVLVHADPDLERLLRSRLSEGLKRSLLTELDSLLSVGSDPTLNPHTRVRSLLEFEEALAEFQGRMKSYQAQERAKKAREKRKQLP